MSPRLEEPLKTFFWFLEISVFSYGLQEPSPISLGILQDER